MRESEDVATTEAEGDTATGEILTLGVTLTTEVNSVAEVVVEVGLQAETAFQGLKTAVATEEAASIAMVALPMATQKVWHLGSLLLLELCNGWKGSFLD